MNIRTGNSRPSILIADTNIPILISNCSFISSEDLESTAIVLVNVADVTITGCIISGLRTGIRLDGVEDVLIKGNNFSTTIVSVQINNTFGDVLIHANAFYNSSSKLDFEYIENEMTGSRDKIQLDDGFSGNYWDGFGNDGMQSDGVIFFRPFRTSGLIDHRPLVRPFKSVADFKQQQALFNFDRAVDRTATYIARACFLFPRVREWVEGVRVSTQYTIFGNPVSSGNIILDNVGQQFDFHQPAWAVDKAIGELISQPGIEPEPWIAGDPISFVRYHEGGGRPDVFGVPSSASWTVPRSLSDVPFADVRLSVTVDGKSITIVARIDPGEMAMVTPGATSSTPSVKFGILSGGDVVPIGGTWAATSSYEYGVFFSALQNMRHFADLMNTNGILVRRFTIVPPAAGQNAKVEYEFTTDGFTYMGTVDLSTGSVRSRIDGGITTDYSSVELWRVAVLPGMKYSDATHEIITDRLNRLGIKSPSIASPRSGYSNAYDCEIPIGERPLTPLAERKLTPIPVRLEYNLLTQQARLSIRRGIGAAVILTDLGDPMALDSLVDRIGSLQEYLESIRSVGVTFSTSGDVSISGTRVSIPLVLKTSPTIATSIQTTLTVDLSTLLSTAGTLTSAASCSSLNGRNLGIADLVVIYRTLRRVQSYVSAVNPGKIRLVSDSISVDGNNLRMSAIQPNYLSPIHHFTMEMNLDTGYVYEIDALGNKIAMVTLRNLLEVSMLRLINPTTGYVLSNPWIQNDNQNLGGLPSYVNPTEARFSCTLDIRGVLTPIKGIYHADGRVVLIDYVGTPTETILRSLLPSGSPANTPTPNEFASLNILCHLLYWEMRIENVDLQVYEDGQAVWRYRVSNSAGKYAFVNVDLESGLMSYLYYRSGVIRSTIGVFYIRTLYFS